MDATGFADLMDAASDTRNAIWGQTIVITDFSNQTHTFTGAVFKSANVLDSVTGGYFNESSVRADIKTSDLSGFVPAAEMIATVAGVTMRIAPDGVIPGTYVYRIRFAAKGAPSRTT